MAKKKSGPRYPDDEYVRLAQAKYHDCVEPILKPKDKGKYVAIDIESGEFEMHKDATAATRKLWARVNDPQPFLFRVGHPAAVRFGFRKVRTA